MSNQIGYELIITDHTTIKVACQRLSQQKVASFINFNGILILFDPANPKTIEGLVQRYFDTLITWNSIQ